MVIFHAKILPESFSFACGRYLDEKMRFIKLKIIKKIRNSKEIRDSICGQSYPQGSVL